MKKIISFISLLLLSFIVWSQAPQGLNYQAVAYNGSGVPVTNQLLGVRLSILDGSATGTLVYQETQGPTTDNTGLFSIVIGNGTVVSGTFASINWGNGTKWLKTEIDIAGGSSYVVMGTTQFMSVPYAFYANTGGLGSPTFSNPDGFNNVTPVVIDAGATYTVPVGKNLYVPHAIYGVKIDGDTLFAFNHSSGTDSKTFLGASENSVVQAGLTTKVCFLVDKKVDWKTIDLITSSYTVPANKQFVIVNATALFTNSGTPIPPASVVILNGISYPWGILSLANSILDEGMIVSSSGFGGGDFIYTINGYLKDK